VLVLVCILWAISENITSFTKKADSSEKKYDETSIRIFHLVTYLSIIIGVIVGIIGIGHINLWYPYLSYLGIAFIIAGFVFRQMAIKTLEQYFSVNLRIVQGHEIIKTGMYGYIRHPSYTGTLISFLGLGLGLASWLSIVVVFVPILIVHLHRMNIEEKMLVAHFGNDYIEYMSKTKRLIPKIY
jgi:protein-S-isoprenylcysteine O-methyltransferase Ste14